MQRIESVIMGKDKDVLNQIFPFYASKAKVVVDVCCNKRRMWKGVEGINPIFVDIDANMSPDIVADWGSLPFKSGSCDVLVYDPPHLPQAAASEKSLKRYATDYGLGRSTVGDNISPLHDSFLVEAMRVLKQDGVIFAKIKDYIHNHKYQWNLSMFTEKCSLIGLTPCDLIIKRDPCGGNLKSGRRQKSHHAKNTHCYWVIIRNGKCEPKRSVA